MVAFAATSQVTPGSEPKYRPEATKMISDVGPDDLPTFMARIPGPAGVTEDFVNKTLEDEFKKEYKNILFQYSQLNDFEHTAGRYLFIVFNDFCYRFSANLDDLYRRCGYAKSKEEVCYLVWQYTRECFREIKDGFYENVLKKKGGVIINDERAN